MSIEGKVSARPKLSADDELQVCRLYRIEKLCMRDIAVKFGVSENTVRRCLMRHGVRRRMLSEAIRIAAENGRIKNNWRGGRVGAFLDEDKAVVLYLGGRTAVSVAKECGVCLQRVLTLLKRRGVTRRWGTESALSVEAVDEICRRRDAGETHVALAAVFGVSEATIRRAYKQARGSVLEVAA